MKGKEKALDALFDGSNDKAAFGYLAVGFNEDATTNGFVDPYINVGQENGFMEIEGSNRKASYKYFYKHGKTLCEKQFIQLSNSLKEFIEKREASNDDW